MDKQSLESLLDQGVSVEQIGKRFGKDPSTVSYWMKKFGLVSPYREKHAAKGGIDRERLEAFVQGGMTIAEIAADVGLSKATVRHWLRRYGLRTRNGRGRRAPGGAGSARAAGYLNAVLSCQHHGETEFVLEARGSYRCKRCRVEGVVRHRRKVKAMLVEEAGGRCCICGYDRCMGALEFHHMDPAEKLLDVSRYGVTVSLEAARAEAAKCVLLCSNCHAEVERGVSHVPARVASAGESPGGHPPG
ncbi:MAG TPA: helix-turn-helix domain-containing protein [Solirubrobacteraceae bacterium]|nr:helix-turn-helix domain-containing protein [Solirubrobacteraceae bacterium]